MKKREAAKGNEKNRERESIVALVEKKFFVSYSGEVEYFKNVHYL